MLADSTLNFKLKANIYIEVNNNIKLIAPIDALADKKEIGSDGIFLQPNMCYKLIFSAGEYKFTENEELTVSVSYLSKTRK